MSTYLRRRGRLTRSQALALEVHGPEAVVGTSETPLNLDELFDRAAPVGLEIGFGTGQALVDWAEASPDWNLLGIEIYEPGIGNLLKDRTERGIEHLKVFQEDATVVLESMIPPEALSEVRVFFPDPWPKKRHQKRRLINSVFASLLASRMCSGARLRLATDWESYATSMLKVLEAERAFSNEAVQGYAPRFEGRNVTRFEARGQRLGHQVWDLCYKKT